LAFVAVIHSDVDTLERIEIMQDFTKGIRYFDWWPIYRVKLRYSVARCDSLVKESLRSHRSLTIGRAETSTERSDYVYADKITSSMQKNYY
jgi:excinuclease UvrABC helicase subunit UvrB